MMDALTDPRIERVVLMTSARVGKTQCLNNLVGYHIHQDPAPLLLVLPTETRAEEWADDEFDPMVRDTPVLRAILGDRKSRASKQRRTHRQFPGGRLYMVGANAPSGLAAKTIRVVLADEVDRFPASAGNEGDPVTLAEKRTATIWNRKIVLSSTPTTAGNSRIETAYAESDQRRFWVACPHCDHHQTLKWAAVKWSGDDPATALYYCDDCGAGWTDAQRWAAVENAEDQGGGWRAEAEFRGVAGFHLNEIYSPWRRLAETVREYLNAKSTPERLKVWLNTAMGETWRDRGDAPEWERLLERREEYPMGEVPAGAMVLTAGVDAQGDRLEASLWAWGAGYERWLVDHRVFVGSPRDAGVWDELRAFMDRDYPVAGGGTMRPVMACCDTGGHDTAAIYGQIRRLADRRIVAIKGVDGWNKASPVAGPTAVDALVNGKKLRRGLRLYTVAVSTFKIELYRSLWLKREGEEFPPGWVHLPVGVGSEFVRQLASEELRTVKDKRGFSRQEWAKMRDRNEALDCAVYARAALWLAGADRLGARFWTRQEVALDVSRAVHAPVTVPVPASAAMPKPPPVARAKPRPGGGYFGGWR